MADISSHFQEAIEFIGELKEMDVVLISLIRNSSFTIFWFTGFASKVCVRLRYCYFIKIADSVGLVLRIVHTLKPAREGNKYTTAKMESFPGITSTSVSVYL